MGIITKNKLSHTNMRINNITISAGLLLASASAVSVRSQTKGSGLANTISDIGNWLENAGQDIGDFFENDFVDFFEETIPNTAMSGIDWFETTPISTQDPANTTTACTHAMATTSLVLATSVPSI